MRYLEFIYIAWICTFWLALQAFGQTLHPPGTPVTAECTIAAYGVSCGLNTNRELVTITDGTAGDPCGTGGAATVTTCENVAGTLQVFTGSAGATQLNDLSDVTIAAPVTNQCLCHDGTNFKNLTQGAIKTDLDSLDDVAITSQATGNFVRASSPTAWANALLVLADLPTGSLVSTEMDTFGEFISQVVIDQTFACDAKSYIRADGKCFPANAVIEAANTAESPSDTDGIQEAIDRCPTNGGCIVQLACDTTYVLDDVVDADNFQLLTISALQDDVWVRGCGAGSTTISFTGNTRTSSTPHTLQAWDILGDRVRLSDFYFLLDDACGDVSEACLGGGSIASAIKVGAVEDFQLVTTRIVSRWGGSATTHPNYRAVWFYSPFANRALVSNNRIASMGRGLEIQFGDNIRVIGNYFAFDRPAGFTGEQGMLSIKYEGTGVQYIANEFNMQEDVGASNPGLVGLILANKFGDNNSPGEYAQIIGNTFDNIPGNVGSHALLMSNYKHAFVDNNLFKTGLRCSTERGTSCTVATQVADCASDVCTNPDNNGIDFDNAGGGTSDGNNFNIFTANTFEGFDDDGADCPIQILAATTSGDNEENIFSNNIFDSTLFNNPTTDDGFCGDEATIRGNFITNNIVTGQAEQCVVGRGEGTACVLSQDLSVTVGQLEVAMQGYWFTEGQRFAGANPQIALQDTDFVSLDSATFAAGCTGTDFIENCDITIRHKRDGVSSVAAMFFDADGPINVTPDNGIFNVSGDQAAVIESGGTLDVIPKFDANKHLVDSALSELEARNVFLQWDFQHVIGAGLGVADADEYVLRGPSFAWTLTRIDCEAYSGTSVTMKICKGEDIGDDTCATSLHTAATIVCDTVGGDACASGCDTTIANSSMGVRQEYTFLVDSVSGSVFNFTINLEGTID